MKIGTIKSTTDDEIEELKSEIEELTKENILLNDLNIGMINVMKSLIEMFETTKEEDGEHTLHVSHKALVKLKNKIEEVIK